MNERQSRWRGSPLHTERGSTTVGNKVVARIAGKTVGEVETAIGLTLGIEYGKDIVRTLEKVREEVTDRVESLIGLRITELNVTVSDLVATADGQGRGVEKEAAARWQADRATRTGHGCGARRSSGVPPTRRARRNQEGRSDGNGRRQIP